MRHAAALLAVAAGAAGSGGAVRRAVLATYAGTYDDCDQLRDDLVAHGANSYSFLLEDTDGRNYLSAVRCLAAFRNLTVGGVPFTAWLTLIPPSEGGTSCSVPADSPLTTFNETALFNQSMGHRGCGDYRAWADVTGRLSAEYPNMRYLNVDDLTHNPATFTKALVGEMQQLLRPNARLVPVVYYGKRAAAAALPIDGMLFYFRNEKAGGCPAQCGVRCQHEWPGGACLAGACAERTVANVAGEVADVRAALPSHLPLHVGIYVTGRPPSGEYNCSTPSAAYGGEALEAALRLPDVSGVTAYRMQTAATPQRAGVAAAYDGFDGRCPTRAPFLYGNASAGLFCCASTAGAPNHCDGGGECCLSPGSEGGCQGHDACGGCPSAQPHLYGNAAAGWFCCAGDAVSTCPGGGECCLAPGVDEGCQGHHAC